jgi:hypothetical protein
MSLLVYNLTAAPLVLANGLSTTIPASTAGAGVRGLPWYASGAELKGRSGAEYLALQAQVSAGVVQYEWEQYPEYPIGVLVATSAGLAASNATSNRGDQRPQTELTAAILAGDVVIPVVTTLGFALAGQVNIENGTGLSELVNYTGVTPTSLTGCTRGVGGTAAVGHAINSPVQQFKRVFVYANATGDDSTGDGSVTKPFKTFQKAARYVADQAMINWNAIYLVDLTGLGKEVLPAEFVFPPLLTGTIAVNPPVPVGVFLPSETGVNFFATPTVVATITDANIPCKTNGAVLAADASITVVDTTGFPAVATEAITDAPLTATATTVNVLTSTAAFPAFGILKIESELISYSAKTATSFTGCVRGYAGTVAAVHVVTTAVAQANIIKIDNELMTYAAITLTTFANLNRGMFGTTAAGHATAVRVLLSEEDGMVKYVTNLAAVNYQGKVIMGSANGQFACIANDSSADPKLILEVPSTSNFKAPFTVGDPSAEINRNTQSGRSFLMNFNSSTAQITFAGLKLTHDFAGANPANTGVEFTAANAIVFNMCDFDVTLGWTRAWFCVTQGCILRRQIRIAGTGNNNLLNNVYLNTVLKNSGTIFGARYLQGIFIGCTPVGQGGDNFFSALRSSAAPSGVAVQNCRIRTSTSTGILLDSGGRVVVLNTTVKGCAGAAVKASVPGLLSMDDCYGYGNVGAGIQADDGGHMMIGDARTSLSGVAGDLVSGSMAARTLADFRSLPPLKNQFDVPGFIGATTATTTGARIWQP